VVVTWGRKAGGTYYLGGPNSWGETSKTNTERPGCWEYSERALRDIPNFGAWALRSVTYS
jgi:hypothetical protein